MALTKAKKSLLNETFVETSGNQTIAGVKNFSSGIISGPLFSAGANASTSLTQNTLVKVNFQVEEGDSNNCYDTSLSRFTPNVAGWYNIGACVRMLSAETNLQLYIYKNGVQTKELSPGGSSLGSVAGWSLIYLNGTTDYVEIFCRQAAATQNSLASANNTWFQGYLVRA
jgi:hypothetical protein